MAEGKGGLDTFLLALAADGYQVVLAPPPRLAGVEILAGAEGWQASAYHLATDSEYVAQGHDPAAAVVQLWLETPQYTRPRGPQAAPHGNPTAPPQTEGAPTGDALGLVWPTEASDFVG